MGLNSTIDLRDKMGARIFAGTEYPEILIQKRGALFVNAAVDLTGRVKGDQTLTS
jgi:hypothetical protein